MSMASLDSSVHPAEVTRGHTATGDGVGELVVPSPSAVSAASSAGGSKLA